MAVGGLFSSHRFNNEAQFVAKLRLVACMQFKPVPDGLEGYICKEVEILCMRAFKPVPPEDLDVFSVRKSRYYRVQITGLASPTCRSGRDASLLTFGFEGAIDAEEAAWVLHFIHMELDMRPHPDDVLRLLLAAPLQRGQPTARELRAHRRLGNGRIQHPQHQQADEVGPHLCS
eukprot:197803-Pelagomonas_calceolata.AAC.2